MNLATNLRHSLYKREQRRNSVSKSCKGKEASGKYLEAFSHQYESVHKNGDGQDSRRRTIISCSTRQLLEIPMYCCLLTEIVASPAVTLLFIKGEIRFNDCGEASFVTPNASVDEIKRCIRSLEAHQGGLPLWKVTFFFPESV